MTKIQLHNLEGCTCNIDTKVTTNPIIEPEIPNEEAKIQALINK